MLQVRYYFLLILMSVRKKKSYSISIFKGQSTAEYSIWNVYSWNHIWHLPFKQTLSRWHKINVINEQRPATAGQRAILNSLQCSKLYFSACFSSKVKKSWKMISFHKIHTQCKTFRNMVWSSLKCNAVNLITDFRCNCSAVCLITLCLLTLYGYKGD